MSSEPTPPPEESTSPPSSMRRWGGTLARLAVSAGILAWVFRKIFQKETPEQFWQTLTSIHPLWLAAALGLFGLTCLFGIFRWHAILGVQGLHLGWARTTGIFFIGSFFNTFMLGVTGGDITKAYYTARETHHKQTEAVMTVIVDRLVGFIGLVGLCAAVILSHLHYLLTKADPKLRSAVVLVIALMAATILMAALGFWRSLPQQLPLARWMLERIPAGARQTLSRAADAYQIYARHPFILFQTFIWSLGVHVSVVLTTIALAKGLGVTSISAGKFFLVLPLINYLTAIPITISGLGMREGLYLQLLGPLGLRDTEAVGRSLLFFVVSLVWNLVGGIVFLQWRQRK